MTYYLLINTNNYKSIIIIMTFTFKRKLMGINKSPRRIKRDAGGRNKNSKAQLVKLLYGEPNSPLYKPKVKPSEKTYIGFTRKK